ncbi:MAG: Rab family GTPase [Promethearchaeota archaeon]|jgi:small GTP-binding protein
MDDSDFKFKICLLGEGSVGKTALLHRFIENKFHGDYKSTLGVNILQKHLEIDGNSVSTNIWDFGGQEAFKRLRKLYLGGSKGALVIFDLTNKESFEKLGSWIKDFRGERAEKPFYLIGNKNDLKDQIVVTEEEAKLLAKEHGVNLIITSAKTGENVEQAFINLTKNVLEVYLKDVAIAELDNVK